MINKKDLIPNWFFSDIPGGFTVIFVSSDYLLKLCAGAPGEKVMLEIFDLLKEVRYQMAREPWGNYTASVHPLPDLGESYDDTIVTSKYQWVTLAQKLEMQRIVREVASRRKYPLPEQQLAHWKEMEKVLGEMDIYNPGMLVFPQK